MSSSESGKTSIKKYVPDQRVELFKFLESKGLKQIEDHIILVNGNREKDLKRTLEKNDEIIVLPILRGG